MTRQEHLLTIFAEECAEVAQRVSKALRFGLNEVQKGQLLTNAQRIKQELTDVLAVYEMLEFYDDIESMNVSLSQDIIDKQLRVLKIMDYSYSQNTIL